MKSLRVLKAACGVSLLVTLIVGCGSEEKKSDAASSNPQTENGAGSTQNGIYGTWGGFPTVRVDDGEASMTFTLTYAPGSATVDVLCQFDDGDVLTSRATAKAEFTSDKIRVLEEREEVKRENGKNCRAALHKKELSYVVSADRLEMSENGEILVLKRVK